jgi:hypothetical protein
VQRSESEILGERILSLRRLSSLTTPKALLASSLKRWLIAAVLQIIIVVVDSMVVVEAVGMVAGMEVLVVVVDRISMRAAPVVPPVMMLVKEMAWISKIILSMVFSVLVGTVMGAVEVMVLDLVTVILMLVGIMGIKQLG